MTPRLIRSIAPAVVALVVAACGAAATASPAPGGTAAPAGAASPSSSVTPKWTGPLDKVNLRLDWFVNGTHGMYYLGIEKGFYAEQGIDLTIGEGKGSGATAQIIGSGADSFGIADTSTAAVAAGKGAAITVVATFERKTTMDITVLESSGIKTPKDLKGKRIGGTPAGATMVLLPGFLAANGMTMADITQVNVDPTATQQALVDGRIDGIAEFTVSQAPVVEIVLGKKVGLIQFADWGLNVLGPGLIVNNAVLSSKPDLVKRFVAANIKAWKYATEHVDESAAAALRNNAQGNLEVFKVQAKRALDAQDTPNSKGSPSGWAAKADVDETVKLLQQYLDLPKTFDGNAFWNNSFLPK